MLTRRTILAGLGSAGFLPWRGAQANPQAATLAGRFPPPAGFARAPVPSRSFAGWLRDLRLLPHGSPVRLHTGALKPRQDVHAAVVDIDVGSRDLQQCADAVMRLRAEWLFANGRAAEVAFNDTGEGKPMAFSRWAEGWRPKAEGRKLVWSQTAKPEASYASFRSYLDSVFNWAGTYSLERELRSAALAEVASGDVVIRGGFPGHAVIVADVALAVTTGERRVLLAQSFMPAQSIHVLKNPAHSEGSPWYHLLDGQPIVTPEWTFPPGCLRRWRT
ncbi:MAG: DUF4846 domain-containing protein [Hyphomicrobiaceae bacterium]